MPDTSPADRNASSALAKSAAASRIPPIDMRVRARVNWLQAIQNASSRRSKISSAFERAASDSANSAR